MVKLKKLFSYIYPIKERTILSPLNGTLEITWENGRRVVNTKNANYSYGSLHKVFQNVFKDENLLALAQMSKANDTEMNILILGFGAGSIYKIIREEWKSKFEITSIEKDENFKKIIPIFFPKGLVNCEVIYRDALDFLKSNTKLFDLILTDLFVDNKTLDLSLKPNFVEAIKSNLTPNGIYVHNTMFRDGKKERDYFLLLEQVFPEVVMHTYCGSNSVFVCKNNITQQ